MRIVFVGNCQILTLCQLYRHTLDESDRRDATYIPSYESMTDDQSRCLDDAESIVWQVTDMDQRIDRPTDGRRCYLVPVVTAQFLFPLSGQCHPQNRAFPFSAEGPYPGEMGDSLLNQMIVEKVGVDEAVERYFETDVAARFNVERVMEITLDRQKQRDQAAGGYKCADIIADRIHEIPLFLTRGHLYPPITAHMAELLFTEMKLSSDAMEAIRDLDSLKFVPPSQQPIHPSVARKLALGYFREDDQYAFHFEGRFSARDWAARYLRFDWSTDLAEGLWHFYNGRPSEAIPFLERARIECPGAPTLEEVLKHARASVLRAVQS